MRPAGQPHFLQPVPESNCRFRVILLFKYHPVRWLAPARIQTGENTGRCVVIMNVSDPAGQQPLIKISSQWNSIAITPTQCLLLRWFYKQTCNMNPHNTEYYSRLLYFRDALTKILQDQEQAGTLMLIIHRPRIMPAFRNLLMYSVSRHGIATP